MEHNNNNNNNNNNTNNNAAQYRTHNHAHETGNRGSSLEFLVTGGW